MENPHEALTRRLLNSISLGFVPEPVYVNTKPDTADLLSNRPKPTRPKYAKSRSDAKRRRRVKK